MGGLVDTVKENPMLLAIPAAAVAGPALFPALAGGAGAAEQQREQALAWG